MPQRPEQRQRAMKYHTTAAVLLPAGTVLGLSEAQAQARAHSLRPAVGRAGQFVATGEIHLKAGEPVEFSPEAPKAFAGLLAARQARSAAPRAQDPPPAGG